MSVVMITVRDKSAQVRKADEICLPSSKKMIFESFQVYMSAESIQTVEKSWF